MANIKQQKKRIVIAQRQRMENLRYRSTIKTLFNRLQLAVDTGDKDSAQSTHRELVKLIDRAIARGVLHRNTAARKKARAARILLQEPKTDTQTVRKSKKKAAPARAKKAAAPKAEKAEAKKPAAKKPVAKKDEPAAEAPAEEAAEAPEAAAEETAAPEAEATEAAAPEAAADEAAPADEAADEKA